MELSSSALEPDPGEDVHEFIFSHNMSDGFPVVPPTRARVIAMVGTGTRLQPSAVLGKCPPSLSEVTVEKVAINAVMAGCTPAQFNVVVAAVRAMLDPKFNLHGLHATTMGGCPIVVVNGPARVAAGLNARHGACGSGSRPNASVGRAIKLVLQNIGGAQLGGTESTTIGSPNKWGLCISEREEILKQWRPYHTRWSVASRCSSVTLFGVVSGPYQLVDLDTTDPHELVARMAAVIKATYSAHFPLINDILCVISPEHHTLLSSAFPTKLSFQQALFRSTADAMLPETPEIICRLLGPRLAKRLRLNRFATAFRALRVLVAAVLVHGYARGASKGGLASKLTSLFSLALFAVISEPKNLLYVVGLAIMATGYALRCLGKPFTLIPKVVSPQSFHVVVTGAEAGKFSAFFPGFGIGRDGPFAGICQPTAETVAEAPGPADTKQRLAALAADAKKSAELLNPRSEAAVRNTKLAPREGKGFRGPVALLDISKGNGDALLDRIQSRILKSEPRTSVLRFRKPTFSKPCPPNLLRKIVNCGARHCMVALAD